MVICGYLVTIGVVNNLWGITLRVNGLQGICRIDLCSNPLLAGIITEWFRIAKPYLLLPLAAKWKSVNFRKQTQAQKWPPLQVGCTRLLYWCQAFCRTIPADCEFHGWRYVLAVIVNPWTSADVTVSGSGITMHHRLACANTPFVIIWPACLTFGSGGRLAIFESTTVTKIYKNGIEKEI